jgi:beta-lactamase regulating signal transducer with metallopeptidase domain/protein involved in polysaccharide export with SLBB domain
MKDALALALVHFIWQGALLGITGGLLIRLAKTPSIRYAIGITTMVAMLAAPALTFVAVTAGEPVMADTGTRSSVAPAQGGIGVADPGVTITNASEVPARTFRLPTTWILGFWGLGVAVLSLRLIGGWAVARRMATQTLTPVGAELQHLAAQVASRLNVRRAVSVCVSASVAVPIMIGWLRPVIVLPAAVLAALPLAQLEALLAHEFAHIRRHDYLVNLLQSAVETICFYHPAVWWMSREVRRQREQCCDDIAVGVCDRLTYVSALSALASMAPPRLALAATGGSLRDRVRRLVEPTSHSSAKGGWMAMFPILLVVSFVAPQAWDAQAVPPVTAPPVAVVEQAPVVPVAPPTVAPVVVQAPRRPSVRVAPTAVPPVGVQSERRVVARQPVGVVAPRPTPVMRRSVQPVGGQAGVSTPGQASDARRREQVSDARQREIEANLTEVSRRLRELRAEGERTVAGAELASLELRLRQEVMTVARQKELADKGLSTRDAVAAAELRVEGTRLEVQAARALHDIHQREVGVSRAGADTERMTVELRAMATLDPDAIVQAQDRLTIAVAGEPDLPTAFTVSADGAIRFPFLGSIRVQGSTASQVQSVIQKLIADKGLAQNPSVTVSVRRARGR